MSWLLSNYYLGFQNTRHIFNSTSLSVRFHDDEHQRLVNKLSASKTQHVYQSINRLNQFLLGFDDQEVEQFFEKLSTLTMPTSIFQSWTARVIRITCLYRNHGNETQSFCLVESLRQRRCWDPCVPQVGTDQFWTDDNRNTCAKIADKKNEACW